jgi:hypothetical protein
MANHKDCPNCNSANNPSFDQCWKCNYDFTQKRILPRMPNPEFATLKIYDGVYAGLSFPFLMMVVAWNIKKMLPSFPVDGNVCAVIGFGIAIGLMLWFRPSTKQFYIGLLIGLMAYSALFNTVVAALSDSPKKMTAVDFFSFVKDDPTHSSSPMGKKI